MRVYKPIPYSIIDITYEEYSAVIAHLRYTEELSLANYAENSFKKSLLLACASFWEHRMQHIVENLAHSRTDSDEKIVALIRGRVIKRQYHSWFDWDNRSATGFFKMFGENYKIVSVAEIKSSPEFKQCVDAFMEIGSLRNSLVHNNFAQFSIDKTLSEIYILYQSGMGFIDYCECTLL